MKRLIAIKQSDSFPNHYRYVETILAKNEVEQIIHLATQISLKLPICPDEVLEYLTESAVSWIFCDVFGSNCVSKSQLTQKEKEIADLYNIDSLINYECLPNFNVLYEQNKGKEITLKLLDCRIAEFEFVVDCFKEYNLSRNHPAYLEMENHREIISNNLKLKI